MHKNFRVTCLASMLLLAFSLQSHAYDSWLAKARVGFINMRTSLPINHLDSPHLRNGYGGEFSLTKLFTPFVGMELGASLNQTKTKGTTTISSKNINMIPLNGLIQCRLPIKSIFVPYVGAGGAYDIPTNLPAKLKLKNAKGFVYQAGFDFFFRENIGINLDVKRYTLKHRATDTSSNNQDKFKMKIKTTSTMVGVVISF